MEKAVQPDVGSILHGQVGSAAVNQIYVIHEDMTG